MPTYDTLLRVHNFGPARELFEWNNQKFYVPAAKTTKSGDVAPGEAYVSFDAVVNRLGDPRSQQGDAVIRNDDGSVRVRVVARESELRRLHIMYGTYSENHGDLIPLIPNIRAWNMDDDPDDSEPIIFPVEDPHCDRFAPDDIDESQLAIMQRQLDKLRRTQQILEQQLSQSASGRVATEEDNAEVDTDEADTIVRPTARNPKPNRNNSPVEIEA